MRHAAVLMLFALWACGPSSPPATGDAGAGATAGATSACSARNDAGQACDVKCAGGEIAVCRNTAGNAEPTCACNPRQ